MIVTEKWNKNYKITDAQAKITGNSVSLTWKFKQGEAFLIFAHSRKTDLDYDFVLHEMQNENIDEGSYLKQALEPIYQSVADEIYVFVCKEEAFMKNGKKFTLNGKKYNIDDSFAFDIVAVDEVNDNITIFIPTDEDKPKCENVCFVQTKVVVDLYYKKKLFGSTKLCILSVGRIDNYDDGAVVYKVDGVGKTGEIPLPKKCLGQKLYIEIPTDSTVNVKIAEKYKKLYQIKR